MGDSASRHPLARPTKGSGGSTKEKTNEVYWFPSTVEQGRQSSGLCSFVKSKSEERIFLPCTKSLSLATTGDCSHGGTNHWGGSSKGKAEGPMATSNMSALSGTSLHFKL